MRIFSYFDADQTRNNGLLIKGGLDKPEYVIDWSDGVPAGDSLSTATTAAVDSSNVDASSTCVISSTVSALTTKIIMKTCGASGTSAAVDGARFRLRTTVTMTTAAVTLVFDAFVYIQNPVYGPSV